MLNIECGLQSSKGAASIHPKDHKLCRHHVPIQEYRLVVPCDFQKCCQAFVTFIRCGRTSVNSCRTEGWFIFDLFTSLQVNWPSVSSFAITDLWGVDSLNSLNMFKLLFSRVRCHECGSVTHNHCQISELGRLSLGKKHNNFQKFFKAELHLYRKRKDKARSPRIFVFLPFNPRCSSWWRQGVKN